MRSDDYRAAMIASGKRAMWGFVRSLRFARRPSLRFFPNAWTGSVEDVNFLLLRPRESRDRQEALAPKHASQIPVE